jgi:hypothetical protein
MRFVYSSSTVLPVLVSTVLIMRIIPVMSVLLGIRPRSLIDFLSLCFRTLADCNVIDRRLADAALQ